MAQKIKIAGIIVSGLEKGGRFLSLERYRRQIKEIFGFEPYQGTLNVKIEGEGLADRLKELEPTVIEAFVEEGHEYGGLHCYRCEVDGTQCVLIVPLRTEHKKDILEIIGHESIKEKLGKTNGDSVMVII